MRNWDHSYAIAGDYGDHRLDREKADASARSLVLADGFTVNHDS